MKKTLLLALVLCLAAAFVFTVGAQDKNNVPVKKAAKDMTVEELAERLSKLLDLRPEVMDFVPGFGKGTDPDGKRFYTYNGARIDSLEKGKLMILFNGVTQELARLNTERTAKQLESIQRGHQTAMTASQASRITPVVAPPQPPPSQPRAVEPPKVPQTPPQIPRR